MHALEALFLVNPAVAGLEALLEATPYKAPTLLGRGAMGTVYAVEHRFLGRRFALKLVSEHLATDAQYVDRVRLEAQALGRLEHPNVVSVVDFWLDRRGRPCIVMELLTGRTLADELRARKRLPLTEAVSFTCQALAGLSAAHDLGIVHRDVKPENLFLQTLPGQRRVLKVLDFGIARVLPNRALQGPAPLCVPTATGAVVGSPRFMSPEAERGERLDARADVFSTGLVMYEMIAGRCPAHGRVPEDASPSKIAGERRSPLLDAVLLRAIAPRPEDRYATAKEFRDELERAELLRLGKVRR
jgi:serine/threonine protein kinase